MGFLLFADAVFGASAFPRYERLQVDQCSDVIILWMVLVYVMSAIRFELPMCWNCARFRNEYGSCVLFCCKVAQIYIYNRIVVNVEVSINFQ